MPTFGHRVKLWRVAVAAGVAAWLVVAPARGEEGLPTNVPAATVREEGALRDFKADFHVGLFAAEEEVRAGEPTWWRATREPSLSAVDVRTGLRLHLVELPRNDPIEQMHVMAEVYGHNWAILDYLARRSTLEETREDFLATDPSREELRGEEEAARQELKELTHAASDGDDPSGDRDAP